MNQPIPSNPAYSAMPAQPPLRAVQRLGVRTMRDGMYVGLIVALVAHVAAIGSPDYTMWLMHEAVVKMNRELKAYFKRTYEVEVVAEKEKEKEDEKPVEEVPIPVETEPEAVAPPLPAPDAKPENDDPYKDPEPYVPPAAQAAEAQDVLTADDDGAVDMTGEGWDIHDNDGSTSRATGTTGKTGRKDGHVTSPNARPDGTGDGPGKGPPKPPPPPPPAKDLSRAASVVGGSWGCPFPPQADLNQVDRASVTLSITVGANGRASSASVVSDPGYGFGAQARRCAMSKSYVPALNKAGQKIAKTIVVRVKFQR